MKAIMCYFKGHVWRYIGRRDAKYCSRDYIYECCRCMKYDVTHIRKHEAINDLIIDNVENIGIE